jgi:hypothetical protein
MPIGGRRQLLLHARPGPIDPGVEDGPALAVGRLVVGPEHVEVDLGIGRSAQVAEAPLLEQRLEGQGRARLTPQALGGGPGPGEVARHDPRNTLARQPAGQALGLRHSARGKGVGGMLNDAGSVTDRLAVTDQKDRRTHDPMLIQAGVDG